MAIDLFSAEERATLVGRELGVSKWYLIDQARNDDFGRTTSDIDPMHMDPAWSKTHSPYGGTIAYGFLTLSLLTHLLHDIVPKSPRESHKLNYGFNRVRMTAPVRVGERVRARASLRSARERTPHHVLCHFDLTVEVESARKPALVAEWLLILVEKAARGSSSSKQTPLANAAH
jgi:acyl dehydratase